MSALPQPRNPRRMPWSEVPDAVVAAIGARAGSVVGSVEAAALGFSPGFAGVVRFSDGSRLFLKVMSGDRDPWSIHLNRREAEVLAELPGELPVPRLEWTLEVGDWFVLATDVIDGEHPVATNAEHSEALWAVFEELASAPAPAGLQAFHESDESFFTLWRTIAEDPGCVERLSSHGEAGKWALANLDRLVEWGADGAEASEGDALVHGDLRADNILLAGGRAFIVDWPWATRGAAWLDLAGYLPSHEMNGGDACWDVFHAHPLSRGVELRHERGIVAALAGYFTVMSTEPPHPALPGLREFQRAQAAPALRWLRRLT
ncbi:phosphotransferase family protein [Demequina sp.]|uniref:phosphotransferase family protein n=1 Tax=Demequina sp. TaxID=2050685 RepID=UPI003D098754